MNRIRLSVIMLLGVVKLVTAQEIDRQEIIDEVKPLNNQCLECHGQGQYTYANDQTGEEVKAQMCDNYIISEKEYYQSNHYSFACIDCHSIDFEKYPHPSRARFEQAYNCTDCHGFTDDDKKFQFNKIKDAYEQSVHHKELGKQFSCWSCHEPHSYSLTARKTDSLDKIVAYNNSMCLDCHSDKDKFEMLAGEEMNVMEHHDWLPNQKLHFNNVRCIECHTKVNEDMMVAHNVQPKEKAVRNCVECHSKNSLLLSTLYKHKVKENRQEKGFYNGVILNESYVIGASRNQYLNVVSIVIFFLTLTGIVVHALLRFFLIKK